MCRIPYATFRKKMAGIIDEVSESQEDCNSLIETMYLFSTPANAKALMESIDECETMIEDKKS